MRWSRGTAVIAALPFGRDVGMRLYHFVGRKLRPRRSATTYFGARIRCDTRDFIQATVAHFGTWEPNVSALIERLAWPGDLAIDIGANVGYFTLLLAKRVGPQGRVIAIEAHPRIAALNRANLIINGMMNVRLVNAAVTKHTGDVVLYEGPASNIGSTSVMRFRDGSRSLRVPGVPLFDILVGEELARISLIKIDIEGAEVPVVRALLDRVDEFSERLALIVEAGIGTDPRWGELFDAFVARGFHAYAIPNRYEWSHHFARSVGRPRPIAALEDRVVELLLTRTVLTPS